MMKNSINYDINYIIVKNYPSDKELLERLNDDNHQNKQGLNNLVNNKDKLNQILKNFDP